MDLAQLKSDVLHTVFWAEEKGYSETAKALKEMLPEINGALELERTQRVKGSAANSKKLFQTLGSQNLGK